MTNVTATNLIGKPVYDQRLQKVGKLSHLYADGASHEPTWATIRTGFFGNKESFVPLSLAEVTENDDEIILKTDKDVVRNAPNVEPDRELSPEEQTQLYQHYRQAIEEQPEVAGDKQPNTWTEDQAERSTAGAGSRSQNMPQNEEAARQQESAQAESNAMTRYEEELRVGKREREAGKVRLKKYVVTENTTVTIPLIREKVRVEREPVTAENWNEAGEGPSMSDDHQEIVLHEEIPVVQRQTIPKEHVRLTKTQETENQQVKGEVRKEHVDVERNDNDTR